MKNLKLIALFVLSIAFIVIGLLGLLGVGFFSSNVGLEIIELILGAAGLIIAIVRTR